MRRLKIKKTKTWYTFNFQVLLNSNSNHFSNVQQTCWVKPKKQQGLISREHLVLLGGQRKVPAALASRLQHHLTAFRHHRGKVSAASTNQLHDPGAGEASPAMSKQVIQRVIDYLEDHPRTDASIGRITPHKKSPFLSHKVWPFGRGPTTQSLGDENDHHFGLALEL